MSSSKCNCTITIKSKVQSGKIRTSGKFGHTFANSGNPDETAPYEPSHHDFHCLLSLFFFPKIKKR